MRGLNLFKYSRDEFFHVKYSKHFWSIKTAAECNNTYNFNN